MMRLAYIRWKDAVSEEAAEYHDGPTQAQLVELHEIGFLLDENEEAVVIGMEYSGHDEVRPGRWRLHIPRVSIQEMRIWELDKLPAQRKRRKPAAGKA
jgi:hypothetical protein